MLPYDIMCEMFKYIQPGHDAVSFASCSKVAMTAWRAVGMVKTLRKLLSPVIVVERSGELLFIVATEAQTKRFIRFISAYGAQECVEILAMYFGNVSSDAKRIRIKLVFDEMRDMDKQKMYELLIIKSGLLKELKRRFGAAVLDIAYTKCHKITWNCL